MWSCSCCHTWNTWCEHLGRECPTWCEHLGRECLTWCEHLGRELSPTNLVSSLSPKPWDPSWLSTLRFSFWGWSEMVQCSYSLWPLSPVGWPLSPIRSGHCHLSEVAIVTCQGGGHCHLSKVAIVTGQEWPLSSIRGGHRHLSRVATVTCQGGHCHLWGGHCRLSEVAIDTCQGWPLSPVGWSLSPVRDGHCHLSGVATVTCQGGGHCHLSPLSPTGWDPCPPLLVATRPFGVATGTSGAVLGQWDLPAVREGQEAARASHQLLFYLFRIHWKSDSALK